MNIILVDTTNYNFKRFFGTKLWYSHRPEYKDKNFPEYDWSKDEEFMKVYNKRYLGAIQDFVGKKIFNNSKIIFCLDAPREKIWRNTITDDYKADRVDLTKKDNFKPVFKYTYNELIPKLIEENENIQMVKVKKCEADDIIAIIVLYLKKYRFKNNVYILSSDQDFKQLGYENLYFIDYKKKNEKINLSREEAKLNLRKKIICGDKSDNITCIFPKSKKLLNDKERKKIIENKKELKKYLKDNPDAMDKYIKNKKLIDFRELPFDIKKKIKKKVKKLNLFH